MIEFLIEKETIDYALNKLEKVKRSGNPEPSKFGFEKTRILEGYIGERVVMQYLKIKKDVDCFEYDLLSNKGKRLEIKTISCKSKPLENYLCTVNSHKTDGVHKQKADYYIFLRILKDYSKGWILGWFSCSDFFEKGEFIAKGKDFGNFKFTRANATVLPINKLNKF
jgi:hypothetical protein|tara:strand:- start:122 stop:622 length:501 start_codon:yes stop_codon:yes gene_type:complete